MKHIIPLEINPTFENENIFSSPRNIELHFTDDPRPYSTYNSHSVFGWNANEAQRVEFQGPLVQGPYATMSLNGVSITAHKQEPKTVINLSVNDTLEIDGIEYESYAAGNGHRHLRQV